MLYSCMLIFRKELNMKPEQIKQTLERLKQQSLFRVGDVVYEADVNGVYEYEVLYAGASMAVAKRLDSVSGREYTFNSPLGLLYTSKHDAVLAYNLRMANTYYQHMLGYEEDLKQLQVRINTARSNMQAFLDKIEAN